MIQTASHNKDIDETLVAFEVFAVSWLTEHTNKLQNLHESRYGCLICLKQYKKNPFERMDFFIQ
jgi:hypothetical protein